MGIKNDMLINVIKIKTHTQIYASVDTLFFIIIQKHILEKMTAGSLNGVGQTGYLQVKECK